MYTLHPTNQRVYFFHDVIPFSQLCNIKRRVLHDRKKQNIPLTKTTKGVFFTWRNTVFFSWWNIFPSLRCLLVSCVAWHIHLCVTGLMDGRHDSLVCVTRLIRGWDDLLMCDVSIDRNLQGWESVCVRERQRESVCVWIKYLVFEGTWLIHVCDSYVWLHSHPYSCVCVCVCVCMCVWERDYTCACACVRVIRVM